MTAISPCTAQSAPLQKILMKKPRSLRSLVASLSSAFCIAVAQAMPAGDKPAPPPAVPTLPAPPASSPETLWKTESFDAVVSLRACPESGACGYIYWLNPSDKKIYSYFGKPRQYEDPATEQDVAALCGYAPRTRFAPPADGKWEGRMELRGMDMEVNVNAVPLDDNRLRVTFSKGFIRQTETWTKVSPDDKRYPRCDLKKATP